MKTWATRPISSVDSPVHGGQPEIGEKPNLWYHMVDQHPNGTALALAGQYV
jgi:hypothetical protein